LSLSNDAEITPGIASLISNDCKGLQALLNAPARAIGATVVTNTIRGTQPFFGGLPRPN
jgi:hypothetical protein